jgi:hypothetical protein
MYLYSCAILYILFVLKILISVLHNIQVLLLGVNVSLRYVTTDINNILIGYFNKYSWVLLC